MFIQGRVENFGFVKSCKTNESDLGASLPVSTEENWKVRYCIFKAPGQRAKSFYYNFVVITFIYVKFFGQESWDN